MANPFPMTTEQQTEFLTYLEDVYERWDEFENCRAYVPGEGMWGKVLPEFQGQSLVGLNSMPLTDKFEWQDIYLGGPVQVDPPYNDGTLDLTTEARVHRRWHNKVWYKYTDLEDKDAESALRQDLMDTLKTALGEAHVHPGFMWAGLGYALIDIEDWREAGEAVDAALGTKGFVPWDEEDEAKGDDTDG